MGTTAKVRILYLDQAPADRAQGWEFLGLEPGEFELERVEDLASFQASLAKGPWVVALCRLQDPDSRDLQVLAGLRVAGSATPVVILGSPRREKDPGNQLGETRTAPESREGDRAAETPADSDRLVSTFESMTDAFVSLDRDWTYTYVNRRAGELFGRKPEALVGRAIWEVFPEGVGQPFHRVYERVFETGIPEAFEDFYAPWDRWFENRVVPTREGLSIFFLDITERKRAEAALRASEERFHTTLDSILEGCQLIGTDWRYLYLNDAAARHNRRPNAELLGRTMPEAWPGIEATSVFRMIKRCMDERMPFQDEVEFIFPDGGSGWYDVRCQPVPEGVFALSADITHRKQAEAALRSSEERFKTMFVQAPLGIAVIDSLTGRFEQVNPQFALIAGRPMEELTGLDWMQITHPDDLQADLDSMASLNAGRIHGFQMEKRYLRPDGSLVWIDMTIAPLTGGDPDRPRHLSMIQDITERKQAAEALRAREAQLSVIFDTIADVIFVVSVARGGAEFRFASVSRSFLGATGLQEDQILGKRVEEVVPEPAWGLVLGKYREAIATGRAVSWEEVSEYPAGTRTGEVTVVPALDAHGTCVQLIGTVHDITEHRRAAARIQGLNEELEQRVQARTAQLLTANQEMEAFSYSVSHDLRAPLRAISGFAEIVARRHRSSLNEEGQRYVDHIVTASHRMGELIEDLLTYARLGRSGLTLQPLDLAATLAPILASAQARAQALGGEIAVSGRLVKVIGQRTLLSQVLSNLLDNALAYRRPGVPPVIHIEVLPAEPDRVLVRITDNGEGIAPEHHEKVFQVFQRLHGQETHPGTGIGLAIVKKSVELMGGTIHLESEPGRGSAFSFTLAQE